MADNLQFGIRLRADGAGQFVGEITAARAAVKQFADSSDRAADAIKRVGHYASIALATSGLASGAADVVRLADAYSNLEARLRVASEGIGNAAAAQQALFAIANRARVDVVQLAETYGQMARGASDAGISQQRLLGITETLSKAVTLSGGSADAARAALVQFSQGLSAGQLRGEELNSVLEQTPALARAIAEGLGLSTGALRQYAQDGKLSAEAVLEALERSAKTIERQFSALPLTIGQAMTQLRNNVLQTVGDIDQASGVTGVLANGISTLAKNTDIFAAAVTGLSVLGVAGVFSAIATSARAAAVATSLMAVATNPVVAIPALLAAGGAAWLVYANTTEAAERRAAKASEDGGDQQLVAIRKVIDALRERNRLAAAGDQDPTSREDRALQGLGARYASAVGDYQKMLSEGTAPQEVIVAAGKRVGLAFAEYTSAVEEAQTEATRKTRTAFDELRKNYRGDSEKAAADIEDANKRFRGKIDDKELDALIESIRKKYADKTPAAAKERTSAVLEAQQQFLKRIADRITAMKIEAVAVRDGEKAALVAEAAQLGLASAISGPLVDAYEDAANAVQRERDIKAEAKKVEEAYAASRTASIKALTDGISASDKELETLRQASEERGLTEEQLIRLRVARLNDAAAIEIQSLASKEANSEAELYYIEERIKKLRELIGLRAKGADEEIEGAAAKRAADAWKATYSDIERGLTDSLFRGAEAGRSIFRSLRDSIKGMFANLVLRPMVSAVMSPIAQGAASLFGAPGASAASSAGGIGNTIGGLSSLWSGVSGGWSALGSMGTKFAMSSLGESLGLSVSFGAEAGIAGAASGLTTAGSVVSAIGAAAPYVLAAVALYKILASGGETRGGSSYGYMAGGGAIEGAVGGLFNNAANKASSLVAGVVSQIGAPSGGPIGGAQGGTQTAAAIAATIAGINATFARLGSAERVDQFYASLQTSTNARGGVLSGGRLAGGATFGDAGLGSEYSGDRYEAQTSFSLTGEEAVKAFALDLKQVTIQALQAAADVPAAIRDTLSGIDAEGLTDEQATALLQTVDSIIAVTDAAKLLGVQAEQVSTAMLAAAGGAQAFGAALSTYYDITRSDAEKVDALMSRARQVFATYGYALPTTVAAYRSIVEAIDTTSEAGQAAFGALVSLAPAVRDIEQGLAALATTATGAGAAVEGAVAEVANFGEAVQRMAAAVQSAEADYASALDAVRQYARQAAAAVTSAEQRIAQIRSQATAQYTAAQSALASAQSRVASAQQRVADAQQRVADAARAASDRMRDLGKSVREYLAGLGMVGAGTAAPNLAALRAGLQSTAAAAIGGDASAAERLTGSASALLDASEKWASDRVQYQADALMVRQLLGQFASKFPETSGSAAANDPASAARDDLAAAQRELSDAVRDSATAQRDAAEASRVLAMVGGAVLEGSDNLAADYAQAMKDLTRAQSEYSAVLAQTSDVQGLMLENQVALADLLSNLAQAAKRLAAAQSDTPAANAQRDSIGALYGTYFGRTMAPEEYTQTWKPLLDSGASMSQIEEWIRTSPEAANAATMTLDQRVDDLFARAQAAGMSYTRDQIRGLFVNGSHAMGLARVPFDGYTAELHAGERVLTASDNAIFSSVDWSAFGREGGMVETMRAMRAELTQLRADLRTAQAEQVRQARRAADLLEQFDVDGLPPTRA